jgi:hypothetical protein
MTLVGPLNLNSPKRGGSVADDLKLVERCLNGEPEAWDLLYKQCHRPLLVAIKSFAGEKGVDPEFLDEIAARVWYAIVSDDAKLLRRFDPARDCRLITFLGGIARNQLRMYSRSELRLRLRELTAGGNPANPADPMMGISDLEMDDLLATLSMGEREFLVWSTTSNLVDVGGDRFADSAAQWGYRLRRKIQKFYEKA